MKILLALAAASGVVLGSAGAFAQSYGDRAMMGSRADQGYSMQTRMAPRDRAYSNDRSGYDAYGAAEESGYDASNNRGGSFDSPYTIGQSNVTYGNPGRW